MFYTWALGNLVLSVINVLFAIAALVILSLFILLGYKRYSLVGPFIAFAAGVAGIMFFILGTDMRLPMTMIDSRTILHILILAIQLSLVITAIVRMPKYSQQSNRQYYPHSQQYY